MREDGKSGNRQLTKNGEEKDKKKNSDRKDEGMR